MLSEPKIKIFLDDSWTDWITPEEARKYEFTKCIIQELMTKEQYEYYTEETGK